MMLKQSIKSILEEKSGTVELGGWVKTRRDSKAGLSFIQLNDGSCLEGIQIVAENSLSNYEAEILKITAGCSLWVSGQIKESQGKGQSIEIVAEKVEVVGWVEDPSTYPIQPKRHTLEFLRENLHLRPRTNTIAAATRVRSTLSNLIHQYLYSKGFMWIHTPIITTSDCEGAGELFRVSTLDVMAMHENYNEDFFGKETFLTVSGQLNVETYCMALSKVYTFGPTFRAENSNTSRHLAEFWMIEPEIAYADLNDICEFTEDMLKTVLTQTLEVCKEDMEFFNKFIDKDCISRIETLCSSRFEKVTYAEAIKILENSNHKFEFPVAWGLDLQSEHERYLTEQHFKKPVILTDFPMDIKGFYMRVNDDKQTVAAFDILVPGIGEIVGGSQREDRFEVLEKRIKDMGIDAEHYKWYLDLRRYGSVPHSGFGLGLERLVSYITGLSNIRDVIPFPRSPMNANY